MHWGPPWYPESSSLMLSPFVSVYTLKWHQQAADGTSNSKVSPGLVPRDGLQGPRQGNTRKIPSIDRRSLGICEKRHEGQFVTYSGIGLRLRLGCNHQSGEKFSRSITSDCLSRLEDDEQPGFSEEVVRDVSGTMYGGELFSTPRTRARVPHSRLQLGPQRYDGDMTGSFHYFSYAAFRQDRLCRRSS